MDELPAPKGGEHLARRILHEIAERSWEVGHNLGTESQLVERYGVSRATFREAVRLLEHLNAATMKMGRTGGLVVTRPDSAPLTLAAALLLRHEGVPVQEVYQARTLLEISLVTEAISRLNRDGEERLREVLRAEQTHSADSPSHSLDFHHVIADLAQNRPLGLFLEMIVSLSDQHSSQVQARIGPPTAAQVRAIHRAHVAIAEAILERDVDAATARMRSHLLAVENWMS